MEIKKANSILKSGDYHRSIYEYRSIYKKNTKLGEVIRTNIQISNLRIKNYALNRTERCAIFAGYSKSNKVEDYVIYYLRKLREVCEYIIYVSDNELDSNELSKIKKFVDYSICNKHEEYDFGSYKRGYLYLQDQGLLNKYNQLVICNDSCYGPINNFFDKFNQMNLKGLDFWGITSNNEFGDHIQSYFMVFNKSVFLSEIFRDFMGSIKRQINVQEVILKYEVGLTRLLSNNGYIYDVIIKKGKEVESLKKINTNLTVFPVKILELGVELIKVKSIKQLSSNHDGVLNTLIKIKSINQSLYDLIVKDIGEEYMSREKVKFSLIMTTYNRKYKIIEAIDSVLIQNYPEYEVIIIDDGSTDKTTEYLTQRYISEIQSGKIVIRKLDQNRGVSYARNQALKMVKNNWIAYLDSDNILRPNFFSTFADAIFINSSTDIFYAALIKKSDQSPFGFEFNRETLKSENYIDLGVFVHHKNYIHQFSFDEKLKRLVDWDFILQITNCALPVYIPKTVMIYNDIADQSRISVKESFSMAVNHIKCKHKLPYKVAAVIITYNHEKFLEDAIESACQQVVDFEYEVIIFDDFSSDGTWNIISKMAAKYPNLIKGCRNSKNFGQALNFKNAIGAARTDFIAILEGDDVWTDPRKVQKQAEFLISNSDSSMVFSKILVQNCYTNTDRFLQRQLSIDKNSLQVEDFLASESMNLIGTFSTCMFRRYVLSSLPDFVYHQRLSEITVAFHAVNYGFIGYLNSPMTLYRQHENGLWSGSDEATRLKMWIDTRKMAARVVPDIYKDVILDLVTSKTA
jgi:glycosyltransferase involved in cell wall biosynthesis